MAIANLRKAHSRASIDMVFSKILWATSKHVRTSYPDAGPELKPSRRYLCGRSEQSACGVTKVLKKRVQKNPPLFVPTAQRPRRRPSIHNRPPPEADPSPTPPRPLQAGAEQQCHLFPVSLTEPTRIQQQQAPKGAPVPTFGGLGHAGSRRAPMAVAASTRRRSLAVSLARSSLPSRVIW